MRRTTILNAWEVQRTLFREAEGLLNNNKEFDGFLVAFSAGAG